MECEEGYKKPDRGITRHKTKNIIQINEEMVWNILIIYIHIHVFPQKNNLPIFHQGQVQIRQQMLQQSRSNRCYAHTPCTIPL